MGLGHAGDPDGRRHRCREYSGLDLWIARLFWRAENQEWLFREHWLFKAVLHDAAQQGLVAIGILLLIATIAVHFVPDARGVRPALRYLLASSVLSAGLVGVIKDHNAIGIPWDLELFGGHRPYLRLFDPAPPDLKVGQGFPAAHAIGGYLWFNLFVLARRYRPQWQGRALAVPLIAGALLGTTQLVRGGHLLSHDLTSAAIAWVMAWLLRPMLGRTPAPTADAGPANPGL
ncbi:MAG: phosphatase PAP2 family protein [Planctomycetota bacterium]